MFGVVELLRCERVLVDALSRRSLADEKSDERECKEENRKSFIVRCRHVVCETGRPQSDPSFGIAPKRDRATNRATGRA